MTSLPNGSSPTDLMLGDVHVALETFCGDLLRRSDRRDGSFRLVGGIDLDVVGDERVRGVVRNALAEDHGLEAVRIEFAD